MFAKGKKTRAQVAKKVLQEKSAAAQEEFMVDGVRVVLTRKRIKNINLRVKSPDAPVQVSAPYWIERLQIESFVREKITWIQDKQQHLADHSSSHRKVMSAEEIAEAKKCMSACVPPLICEWEAIMGVKSQNVVYRNMTSRWGSCNPSTGRICLNIQLLNYPPQCLEYVVVHELCHLLERGHGSRFKALMDVYMPDWQKRRALLR